MSDFLDHLAAKAVAPQPAVRPVIRTVYEPAAAAGTQQPAPIPFPTWQHPPPPSPTPLLEIPRKAVAGTPLHPRLQAAPDGPNPGSLPSPSAPPVHLLERSSPVPLIFSRETAPAPPPPLIAAPPVGPPLSLETYLRQSATRSA